MRKDSVFRMLRIEFNICMIILTIYTYLRGYIGSINAILLWILGIIIINVLFTLADKYVNR